MLAIYHGTVYGIDSDDLNQCVLLDARGVERLRVDFGSPTLIVDPTDDQVEAARAGRAIPPESCAVCHQNPRHDHEWCYWTRDGYGVCDECGGRRG